MCILSLQRRNVNGLSQGFERLLFKHVELCQASLSGSPELQKGFKEVMYLTHVHGSIGSWCMTRCFLKLPRNVRKDRLPWLFYAKTVDSGSKRKNSQKKDQASEESCEARNPISKKKIKMMNRKLTV
jgi:hypothetical protein